MPLGYQSERVRLVPLEKERHLENCYQWVNDPEITQYLLIGDTPLSREMEEAWFDSLSNRRESDVLFAIELLDGTHIGQSGIHKLDLRQGTGVSGSFIGSPEHRNLGLGTEAAILRSWYAFDVLGLRMLTSCYLAFNERSAKMQAKVGYLEYGRLPEANWKRGRYVDDVLTYLTRERFFELHGNFRPVGL